MNPASLSFTCCINKFRGRQENPRSSPGHGDNAPQACSPPGLPIFERIPHRAAVAARSCSRTRTEQRQKNTEPSVEAAAARSVVAQVLERDAETRGASSLPASLPLAAFLSLFGGVSVWKLRGSESLVAASRTIERNRNPQLSGFNVLLDSLNHQKRAVRAPVRWCRVRAQDVGFCGFRQWTEPEFYLV